MFLRSISRAAAPLRVALLPAVANVSRAGFHTVSRPTRAYFPRKIALAGLVGLSAATAFSLATSSPALTADSTIKDAPETVEGKVGKVGDLAPGQMKEVVVDDVKVLLSNVDGKLHATGIKCPHYGAPLDKGLLAGELVYCPWHAAAFSVVTGEVDAAPSIDGIPVYTVRTDGDDVYVSIPKGAKTEDKAPYPKKGHLCKCSEKRVFVIVGAGGAGLVAAQTLRQDGFKGRVIMITKEEELPYDRPMLSKQVGLPIEKTKLRDEAFYKTHDIEVHRGSEVSEVDVKGRQVHFADGSSLAFDTALLATGASPIRLPIPGNGLEGVHMLRTAKDSASIAQSTEGAKKAVVIGAGFIGLEVASWLRKNKKLDVVIVGLEKVPFERQLGPEVGGALQKLAEENGVTFKLGRSIKEITGNDRVDGVVLDNGETIQADLVVMGTGVRPETRMIKGANMAKDGGVIVDSTLKAADGVYAAGDIAWFPYSLSGDQARIEHWVVAQDQGRVAAHNMMGKNIPYKKVPFFWTNQFGAGLRFAGYAPVFDEVIIDGNLKGRKFVAYFVHKNKVQAVAGMGAEPVVQAAMELLGRGAMPDLDTLRKGGVDLIAHLRKVTEQ